MNNKNCDRDVSNITYSSKVSNIYDTSGQVLPFQRQKYVPIIDCITRYFKHKKDIKLLDVGIGYGAFLKACEEGGLKNLYGMDPFTNSIDIAKNYTSADLQIGMIEDLQWPFEDKYFDVITVLDVVEHLRDPQIFFQNVTHFVVNNGIVVVRTPNKEFPYLMRKLPFIGLKDDNPTHINVHNPKYWRDLALKNGFEIVKDWKGEKLTHIKFLSIVQKIFAFFKIDHRKVPLLNMFEQAYIMVLKLQK